MYKKTYVCLNEGIWLMTTKMRLKMKNRSRRYDINRPRPIHGHKYPRYKMYLDIVMVIYVYMFWSIERKSRKL